MTTQRPLDLLKNKIAAYGTETVKQIMLGLKDQHTTEAVLVDTAAYEILCERIGIPQAEAWYDEAVLDIVQA